MPPLPIDSLVPEILRALKQATSLVLEAPPGAGKSTRVPPALLSLTESEVLVLEPRRIAARMAARRVAFELGQKLGETVGYQVRFEEVASPRTRLRFLTEGILTRRLLSNPTLRGVGIVVLDEFHERHLDGDLALALLRKLQRTSRPDLRLVVMSATLEAGSLGEYLGCPILRAAGRSWPLSISYTAYSAELLETQVRAALARTNREQSGGDVLVFLPGAAEIRRATRAIESIAQSAGMLVYQLHGDLSPEEQDAAVQPAAKRKVILSTNVAESSITIEGVRTVIDSGLARMAADSPWTGLPTLRVARISRASADQRAGRAGRTGPGIAVRLYTEEDYRRRPEHDEPEIFRRELSEMWLALQVIGIHDPRELDWLDPPPDSAVDSAKDLLSRLGALDSRGRLTSTGSRMAHYPMHPRLGRLVIEAIARETGEEGCRGAAILSAGERLPDQTDETGLSDVQFLLDREHSPTARRHYDQIRRVVRPPNRATGDEQGFLISILAAFPDRIMKRRSGDDLLRAGGGPAKLAPNSVVRNAQFLVAVDVEERGEHAAPLVRLASAIKPEWLLDLFPDRVKEQTSVEWNRKAERVEAVSAIVYESLVIEESRSACPESEDAARLLATKALEAGLQRFVDTEEVERFRARVAFASEHSDLPKLVEDDVKAALMTLCHGLYSFTELEAAASGGGFQRALENRLPANARSTLDEIAPVRITLASGRQAHVNYSPHQPPSVSSRLQDFFGMRETPRVARGQVPLVVHLLAPNQRPVQMTTDLAGFWQRLYPQVRRELSRRYPKHSWPEKPV